jgi:hypothetical protein
MDHIDWSPAPPPPVAARIITVSDGTSHYVVLGSWAGIWVHWLGRRSLPCLGERCPRSRHLRPMRWTGYLPAAASNLTLTERGHVRTWSACVLPVGPDQARDLEEHVRHCPFVLEIKKRPGERGWRVAGVSRTIPSGELPAAPDVRNTLYRVWGVRPPVDPPTNPVE